MYRSRLHCKSDMTDSHLDHSSNISGRGPDKCLMDLSMISMQYGSLAELDVAPIAQKSMTENREGIPSQQ